MAYAVCYLVAKEKMPNLTLKTGSDDQAKVYLNGKEVWKCEEDRAAEKDQDSTPNLTLVKGYNTIVFKIVNGKADWAGCLRFTDKEGNPVKNFKVVLKPQGKTAAKDSAAESGLHARAGTPAVVLCNNRGCLGFLTRPDRPRSSIMAHGGNPRANNLTDANHGSAWPPP